ncbi:MAG: type II methionyl aminopeptidase [Nanohaloarchaea archaeon]|nr:type II methionyl aminopeptidase [Candidatus Nanohaloarchaea archaeon]
MEQSEKDNYIKAGETVQKARKLAREEAKPGTKLVDIAEKVEKSIRNDGLEPAFPVNLSINEQAAHYTPPPGGDRELKADDVLKVDIGAHSDGFIADTALTVNPSGKHQDMIETVEKVLEEALDFVEPGKTIGEFGRHVERQVPGEYNIVTNLTGHYLDRYTQHAGVSVPNCDNASTHEFKKGDAVAIEPFISTGSGKMMNGKPGNIYMLESNRSVRGRAERKLMGEIKNFNGLPFTSRWLNNYGGRYKMALNKLVQKGVVKSYDVLKDREGSLVAQAEHTVLVGMDGGENIVTTRR